MADALDDMLSRTLGAGMARRRMRESFWVEGWGPEGEADSWTVSISALPRSRPIRLKSDLEPTASDGETWPRSNRIPFPVEALSPIRAFKSAIIDVDDRHVV